MARSFNGTNQQITADALPSLGNSHTAFTWSAWVNGAAQNNAAIITQGNSGSTGNFIQIGVASVSPFQAGKITWSGSSSILSQIGTATIMDSTWHHVCFTVDSSGNWAFYVDGASDMSGTVASQACTTNDTRFGALRRTTTSNFFTGNMGEFSRWARSLSAREVKSLAAGLPASHLGPDHYWPLWGTDSPEPDIGNATRVNGTIAGGMVSGGKVGRGLIVLAGIQPAADAVAAAPNAYTLAVNPGAVAITGADAQFSSFFITASPGALHITGAAATLTTGRTLSLDASTSAFAITGKAATLSLLTSNQFELVAEPAAYTITGFDATLTIIRSAAVGRVNIAFSDGPLIPSPVWTRIDDGVVFPENFVTGYDTTSGRQSLVSQTDTGIATVYINDRTGLFDPRNSSSPYFGNLDGRQILLQLYNPVTSTWQEQFRGLIDNVTYAIDGSAVNASGEPINATIQLECVDFFDYLAGYGLTPGLDGVTPPAGSEDSVYYAATSGSVEDRILEVLTDTTNASWVTSMTNLASGNVKLLEAKYNADDPALTVLRDCADAELPFIANIYVNRHGQFCFRGRYSRFAPDSVSAETGSNWDFHRWRVGDGSAIQSDSTRAQMRVLEYSRGRADIINAAICYPQGIAAANMPNQVYADATSIAAYGKHTPPGPMSDLLVSQRTTGGVDGAAECLNYATLLVKNQKDPREAITALQLKSIDTTDARASATWDILTRSDISDIVNAAVGYPGGTGFTGAATADDYYIEGRSLTVRPANTGYDYTELNLEVSPAVWSMDTHGVFPAFPG